ncbi:helix-turn-helix domain-containing protein [Mariprofundus ferrooxydans]|uniref:helix-turn-helix domain-containing protein n=1 Tax=Mariprofundus ferrooxydans TaxID=314344 RepID=UPI00197D0FB1|nr:helix-turn-helix transcriptional regulator [Mariprofundus ferrooxydans]
MNVEFLQKSTLHIGCGRFLMGKDSGGFADLVRDVRKQLGLSQDQLAREIGVSFATINRWENGKTTPFKLARAQFDAFCSRMVKQGKLKLQKQERE